MRFRLVFSLYIFQVLIGFSCGETDQINALATFKTLNPPLESVMKYDPEIKPLEKFPNSGIIDYMIIKGDTFLQIQYRGEYAIFSFLRFRSIRSESEVLIRKLQNELNLSEGYFDDPELDTNSFKSFGNDEFVMHVSIGDSSISLQKFRGDKMNPD